MKLLYSIFIILFLSKDCKQSQLNENKFDKLEYIANTRGFYQKITIQNKKVSIQKDRNHKLEPQIKELHKKEWDELVLLFKEIQLDNLPSYKDPTQQRFYDGAAIANFIVTYKGKTYESKPFDHGFPPKEIEKIVNKVASFVETNQD